MSETIRFQCPPCHLDKETRKSMLRDSIRPWVESEALQDLVTLFGGEYPKNLELSEKVKWLNSFADIWDYRKKQAQGGERWNLQEDPTVLENRDAILECVRQLGLMDIRHPLEEPDYILPLGGARLSNYARPLTAKEEIDRASLTGKTIVALSGKRPINEVELEFLQEFAPNATTEFDAISTGMEKCFSLKPEFDEYSHVTQNPNLSWTRRKYLETYAGNAVFSLAAPSSDEIRRANSRDTFCFFLEQFDIKEGDKLLLVTSCLYVPFQLLRFMDLAIDHGFYVDCIGMPNDNSKGTSFSLVTGYCQETKAAINAVHSVFESVF